MSQDHLLRTIKRTIDFSFIYDKVKDLYSPVGRRSVDPVLLVKMPLIGYWYGSPSERKLEQEVKLNLAYRWFLGLDLAEPVPDHSTIVRTGEGDSRTAHYFKRFSTSSFRVVWRMGL